MKKLVLTVAIAFCGFSMFAQTPRNPMPRTINVPGKNHISPSLSGDGKHLVFVSNYSSSNKMVLKYTYINDQNQWAEPVELSNVSRTELDFIGGHWLSYDGSLLFFTSKRGPGIGKYDIFFSERKGSYWTPAQNIGKPINSPGNEGHPSLSPDGRFLYFMRCNEMDNYKVEECEIFIAEKKSDNFWHEPVKLPHPINTGNESTPRIMPDGETLVFASKRAGGKGGFDLYQSQLKNGNWTKPVACDYLNTENDDLYVSVPAHGNLVYFSQVFRNFHTIIEAQIPENLKPKRVVLAQGNVVDATTGKPLEAIIQVYNARTKERDQFNKTKADGSFFVLIKGEDVYDFSIMTRENKHIFFSKLYDLRNLEQSKIEDLFVELQPVQDGSIFIAEDIQFEPHSAEIKKESEVALMRLVKFMKENPDLKLEIGAHTDMVKGDSIVGNPDLTEIKIDTLFQPIMYEPIIEDSLSSSLPNPDSLVSDSLVSDSLKVNYLIKYTYHNDRTNKQAQAVVDKLVKMGVPPHLLMAKGYADQKNIYSNNSEEERLKNRRIEIKIVK